MPLPSHSLLSHTHSVFYPLLLSLPYALVLQYYQMTALMHAAQKGSAECTQMLIEAGSDVTAKDEVRFEQCVGVGVGVGFWVWVWVGVGVEVAPSALDEGAR